VRVGLQTFVETVRGIRSYSNSVVFLLANMIYANGLGALFAFGGIYAAGTFGWSTIEIGVFGIFIVIAASVGALLGGRADDALGSKTVVLGALALLIAMSIAILSVDRNTVFFVVPVQAAKAGTGLFTSLPEQLYIVFGAIIGIAAGPLQASSRTLLARIAPPGQIGQFYGLFALSGKLTSFAGPFAVATVTAATASQRAGISVLVAFFAAGALLLSIVQVNDGSGGRP
jgi:UMF1 family MFS transporter